MKLCAYMCVQHKSTVAPRSLNLGSCKMQIDVVLIKKKKRTVTVLSFC